MHTIVIILEMNKFKIPLMTYANMMTVIDVEDYGGIALERKV